MTLVSFGGGSGGGGGGGGAGAGDTEGVIENSPVLMKEREESGGCGGESSGGSELGITVFCRLNKAGRGGGTIGAEFSSEVVLDDRGKGGGGGGGGGRGLLTKSTLYSMVVGLGGEG